MSLPLKPFAIDSTSKQLDSKQKKFNTNVQRALERFDSVTEWADYIASLGSLLKALQSWSPKFQNVKYFVPSPYQVSRRLTSSLSPNLPSGVHQKTLEVYTYIFQNIGIETLAAECNIWIPGILPLMSYASMSVKSRLIELYDTYLVQVPSETLKMLVRPLLASLLPGIDDESSEFLSLNLKLIETLKTNLGDDSLFWQTCFIVVASSKDRRLGGLVWLTRNFPSLNAVPHLVSQQSKSFQESGKNEESDTIQEKKNKQAVALSVVLPEAKSVVSPEPGLLIRCLIRCLDDENDLLLKRGILDLLIQRFHLNSPVLQNLVTENDRKLLILWCCRTTLSKDMSLNRRVWNWLLGPSIVSTSRSNSENNTATTAETSSKESLGGSEYFTMYGLSSLISGLKDMITDEASLVTTFRICLAFMDRWEIGSLVIPTMFIPMLNASKQFADKQQVIQAANTFFDAVETNIIWGKIIQYVVTNKDLHLLSYVLKCFNVENDEEIIVRHLPLVLLTLLSYNSVNESTDVSSKKQRYDIFKQLLGYIPERSFLPLDTSTMDVQNRPTHQDILAKIQNYYRKVSDFSNSQELEASTELELPFSTEDATFLIAMSIQDLVLQDLRNKSTINESASLFVEIFEKIPESAGTNDVKQSSWSVNELFQSLLDYVNSKEGRGSSLWGVIDIYSHYLANRLPFLDSMKLLNVLMKSLCLCMVSPKNQLVAIKSLKSLERMLPSKYIQGALASAFVKETDVLQRILILDLLWNELESYRSLIRQPLEIVLDELFDKQNPHYLSVSKWVLASVHSGSSSRLFQMLAEGLLDFNFLENDVISDLDDLEMFTYRLQLITNVLKINSSIIVKNFSSELTSLNSLGKWENEDVSTYKNLVLVIILKFLKLKNNKNAKSMRSALILLDSLLDGTESNFKDIVIFLLEMSSKYLRKGEVPYELIAVSLLDIVSKVLRLSHENNIKLDIFDDNSTHLKYIDYMVTSVSTMTSSLVITSYVKLLSESIAYFEGSIFRVILPLSASSVQCVQRLLLLEKEHGGYYQSISLLLEGLEELLQVSHGYLSVEEREGYFSGSGARTDFIQSVVSNVFSSDASDVSTRIQGERDVVLQSIRQVAICCFEIWSWAHSIAGSTDLGANGEQVNYNSFKFKFKSKVLLEKLFMLEPLEILENLVNLQSNDMIALVHVLDGNKPAVSLPYFFYGVVMRYNKNTTSKFSINLAGNKGSHLRTNRIEPSLINKLRGETIMNFVISYANSLENAAVEDFFEDFLTFFKEIVANYSMYNRIHLQVLELVGIIALKLDKSQFGEQKRIRRDFADLFARYVPNIAAELLDEETEELEAFSILEKFVPKVQYIVHEEIGGDRYNAVLSSIVTHCLVPRIKNKSDNIPPYVLKLAENISTVGAKVKVWKSLISDIFNDDKQLPILGNNAIWNKIIFEWSQYPENKSKLLNDLLLVTGSKRMGMTPVLITFSSWNDTEIGTKCQNLSRISYLLLVAPVDTYLLEFQSLISCVCQYLVSNEFKLKEKCWVLLRVMFLKFSESHFNEYWSMISYCLQTNLQEFYEFLQLQEEIEPMVILQLCKTLDLLLALQREGFSATNEWLFIIDTINCIYKNGAYMALVDKISEVKDYAMGRADDFEMTNSVEEGSPMLTGVHSIQKHSQLRNFFHSLSYTRYEVNYAMKMPKAEASEADVMGDLFH
ncbi:hypothetical protein KAFR_0B05690 [Kazachstania africana CBS 2517]|uniref:Uncharacterized protein n=1 Tax=Kazachstania africana (strain ATCC 22294 / BCRC 22015 / CBS 2517 / CECT 1963 / NBRC 1671 / NRRL Y-8276) TaxID=1071382 RepID=H2AR65_KAZAF|nr:hypothetical protein KAFR_0B05690 [Kazachstania africana CBS 2517]CCF56865.1 hypothetical protein KAFR_0B05690 [Kazachstania africana CBS 2517]